VKPRLPAFASQPACIKLHAPALLDPLFAPRDAAGVGPKNAKLIDKLLDDRRGARGRRPVPSAYATIDRRARPKIAEAERDAIAR